MNAVFNQASFLIKGTLFHQEDIASVVVLQSEPAIVILEKVKEAGYNMGATSLRRLLSGEVKAACGFTYQEASADDTTVVTEIIETPLADEPVARPAFPSVVPRGKDPKKEGNKAAPAVDPVDAAIVADVDNAPVKVEGGKVKGMRRGTKNDIIFKMMCNGATIKELCEALNWKEGGISSVVYWEPNYKGYGLDKERVEGRGLVIYLTLDGKRIKENQLVYSN